LGHPTGNSIYNHNIIAFSRQQALAVFGRKIHNKDFRIAAEYYNVFELRGIYFNSQHIIFRTLQQHTARIR
jgi:hypothetical protein